MQKKEFIRQLNELVPRPDPVTTEALYRFDRECAESEYHLPFLCYSVSFPRPARKPLLCFMRHRICVPWRGRMPLAQTPPQRRSKRLEPPGNTGLLKLTTT